MERERQQEESRLRSCSMCRYWFKDGVGLRPGWGICMYQSYGAEPGEWDLTFSECDQTCGDFEA